MLLENENLIQSHCHLDENTFMCWAKRFVNYLKSLPGQVIHVLFKNYERSEEVSICKCRSQKGKERNITNLNQTLPKLSDWENFLNNDSNKKRLTYLLCEYILLPHTIEKVVYVTKGEQCFQKTRQGVIETQTLKSKHNESDHRIIHHSYFPSHQRESICIVADDTDVLILLLYISQRCGCEMYFREGTHSSKKEISYHSISLLSQNISL